jgi:hypothetical protein
VQNSKREQCSEDLDLASNTTQGALEDNINTSLIENPADSIESFVE